MTTDHNLSDTTSQTAEDDGPELEFVIRLHAAAKAGLVLLEALESDNIAVDLVGPMRAARAAYDRLAETRQRTRT